MRTPLILAALTLAAPTLAAAPGPTDPQIAHIAYTAGEIDIAAGRQALAKSHDRQVRSFAELMIRDHQTVNEQALALVHKLGVTPQANPTSTALSEAATAKSTALARLSGRAFDRAYIANEVAYHRTVNGVLHDTLIPNADNPELKTLLETGLSLFSEHQGHAEMLAKSVR